MDEFGSLLIWIASIWVFSIVLLAWYCKVLIDMIMMNDSNQTKLYRMYSQVIQEILRPLSANSLSNQLQERKSSMGYIKFLIWNIH